MQPQTTPISQLLEQQQSQDQQDQQDQQDPREHAHQQQHSHAHHVQEHSHQHAHQQSPVVKKTMMSNIREIDWKTLVLVFAIVLIFSSGMFASCMRPYIPGSVGSDGKVSVIGSMVAATLGTLFYAIVKLTGKLNA